MTIKATGVQIQLSTETMESTENMLGSVWMERN